MVFEGLEHVVRENEPLARHTWFRLGGPAEYFAEPTSVEELSQLVRRCRENEMPVRLLGGGSNVLVRDDGVPGLVILLSAAPFTAIEVAGERIKAGGGAKLGHVVSTAVREGLAGLEPLVGIPGTVGGALRGNAGAHGSDIGQWAAAATVLTRGGDILHREQKELRFSYRKSSLDELAILSAEFQLEREDARVLSQKMQKLWIVQKAAQPGEELGTGAIFRDSGASASSLIEQAGLKGTQLGKAAIHDRHPNFVVVHPGATAADVLRLIELARTRVAEQLGVELETEIEIW